MTKHYEEWDNKSRGPFKIPAGKTVAVKVMNVPDVGGGLTLQTALKIDWTKSTAKRPRSIGVGWARVGWGKEATSKTDLDFTGYRPAYIEQDADITSTEQQHGMKGGGPVQFRVKIPGTGYAYCTLLITKVYE